MDTIEQLTGDAKWWKNLVKKRTDHLQWEQQKGHAHVYVRVGRKARKVREEQAGNAGTALQIWRVYEVM